MINPDYLDLRIRKLRDEYFHITGRNPNVLMLPFNLIHVMYFIMQAEFEMNGPGVIGTWYGMDIVYANCEEPFVCYKVER